MHFANINYQHSILSMAVFFFIVTMWWDYVSMELWLLTGPLSIHHMTNEWKCSSGGMILTGENWRTWRKTCPTSLCSPQIPHGLTWKHSWASVVRIQQLTACAMARPKDDYYFHSNFIKIHPLAMVIWHHTQHYP
jgi:hypothetical protein